MPNPFDQFDANPFDQFDKPEGGFGTALAESFAGVGNTADIALSALEAKPAKWFGEPGADEEIYKNLNERIASRNQWANPDNLKTGTKNKVLAGLATLPMGLVTAGLTPAETEKKLLDTGESKQTALAGAGVSAFGNIAGLIAPGFAAIREPIRAIFNGFSNTAQQMITDAVISSISENKASKDEFAPTLEKAILAFATGGVASMAGSIHKHLSQPKQTKGTDSPKLAAVKALNDAAKAPEAAPPDLGQLMAESKARDEATVARLRAAVDKQNPEGGPLYVNKHEQAMGPETAMDYVDASRARQEKFASLQRPAGLDPSAQQMEIDATPHGDRPAQFGMTDTGGRVDENGIPIRADLSMEAQNLQDPLQRNLWGDELPRKDPQEAPRGITSALDRLPPGEQRATAVGQLSIPRGQRGGVHSDLLGLGITDKIVELFKRYRETSLRLNDQKYFDVGSVGDKAAHTRAFNSLSRELEKSGINTGLAIQKMSRIIDYEGMGALNKSGNITPKNQRGAINVNLIKDILDALTFHYGDGGVAHDTTRARMSGGRSTGHFGTGTYFLGEPKDKPVGAWDTRGERPVKSLNLEGLNLFKARDTQSGRNLHEGLKEINDLAKNKQPLDFESPINPARKALFNLSLELGFSKKEKIKAAIQDEITAERKGLPMSEIRSASTRVMQKLGYDGVDVRKTGLDNEDFGSVVYPQQRAVPKNQRGALDFKAISEGVRKDMEEGIARLRSLSQNGLHPATTKEAYLAENIPGMAGLKDRLVPSDAPEKIVADSLQHGQDIPDLGLFANTQSGLMQTSTKFRDHPLLLGAGRVLREIAQVTDLGNKTMVRPLQEHLIALPVPHRVELAELLKHEMFNEQQTPIWILKKAGYTPKQIDTYQMMRAAQKQLVDVYNEGRAKLGKPPITEGEAYLASMRQGDWQFAVVDKAGKPAWFVRVNTKAEAKAAHAYLREKFGDSLNMDASKIEYRKDSSKYHPDTPRDVMGAYSDMLQHFSDNPELSATIKEGIEGFLSEKGYGTLGHKSHFLEKNNIRGFEGDKPWLSDKENANALLQGQINYFKSANQWAATQSAAAKIGELLSSKELEKSMPNAVDLVRQVAAMQLGEHKNVLGAVEAAVARILPASSGKLLTLDPTQSKLNPTTWAVGRSPADIYSVVGGTKTLLYLQLLGLNAAHMIATPLQALITVPAQHRMLTTQGFTHNLAKTSLLALQDFASTFASHQIHELTGKDLNMGMSPFIKDALKYAEDSGVVEKNIFNENVNMGDGPIGGGTKKLLGNSIAIPEKVTRLATYLGFVRHLEASGKFASNAEIFRRASELADNSLTSFRSADRPMMVNKLGSPGNLAYTFKSYLFNYFNQLSQLARHAHDTGNISPLMTNLASLVAVGGVLSVPLMNEMDGAWSAFKDLAAEYAPGLYAAQVPGTNWKPLMGNGLKAAMIEHLPDIASYGTASAALGVALQNRLSVDVMDPEHPFKNLFPVTQDIKEAISSAAALTDPNSTTATQAIYIQMPGAIKGQMETRMPIFRGEDRGQGSSVATNPNHLESHSTLDHVRTASDWNKRAWGLTSLAESKDVQTRFLNNAQSKRIELATDNMAKKIYDAVERKDSKDVELWSKRYLTTNPDEADFKASLDRAIKKDNMTQSERELANKTRLKFAEVRDMMRLRETRGQQ